MKNYLLLFLFLFLFPVATFAHGGSPAMLAVLGYVLIVSFIIGLIEYYLIKHQINVKRDGMIKTSFLSFGITVLGFLISLMFIDFLQPFSSGYLLKSAVASVDL